MSAGRPAPEYPHGRYQIVFGGPFRMYVDKEEKVWRFEVDLPLFAFIKFDYKKTGIALIYEWALTMGFVQIRKWRSTSDGARIRNLMAEKKDDLYE